MWFSVQGVEVQLYRLGEPQNLGLWGFCFEIPFQVFWVPMQACGRSAMVSMGSMDGSTYGGPTGTMNVLRVMMLIPHSAGTARTT